MIMLRGRLKLVSQIFKILNFKDHFFVIPLSYGPTKIIQDDHVIQANLSFSRLSPYLTILAVS